MKRLAFPSTPTKTLDRDVARFEWFVCGSWAVCHSISCLGLSDCWRLLWEGHDGHWKLLSRHRTRGGAERAAAKARNQRVNAYMNPDEHA